MKCTEEQLERSLKKLAKKMAWANSITNNLTESERVSALWDLFTEANKILQKTGTEKFYDDEVKNIDKLFGVR